MIEKKATIVTISRKLGVSPSTVSRAFDPSSRISDDVRKKILLCAKEQNYVPNRAAARLSMKEINIGVVIANTYEPASEELLNGINDAYRALFDLKIHLEIKMLDLDMGIVDELNSALDHFDEFDGLIVSGFNEPDEIDALNRYSKKNKNLVLVQADVSGVDRLFASYHDAKTSSGMAAEFISDCLRRSESRKVALFTGDRRSELHRKAAETFICAAKEFGFNVIASYDMKDSPEILRRQLYDMYENQGLHPDGIYITSGKSLELCRYMEKNGLYDSTVLVTFDVYGELNEYLNRGVVWATVYQNMHVQAKEAFTRLVRYIIGECGVQDIISPTPELVLKSNLKLYSHLYREKL